LKSGDTIEMKQWDAEDAMNWRLTSETLTDALIDATRHNINIPDEFLDSWYGTVQVVCNEFLVTIIAGEP